jgi:hypothetical protein
MGLTWPEIKNDCAGEGQQQITSPNQRLYSVDDRMINEYGAVGGIRTGRGNGSTRRKPAPAPLCPSQIPHYVTYDRTRAATVGSR